MLTKLSQKLQVHYLKYLQVFLQALSSSIIVKSRLPRRVINSLSRPSTCLNVLRNCLKICLEYSLEHCRWLLASGLAPIGFLYYKCIFYFDHSGVEEGLLVDCECCLMFLFLYSSRIHDLSCLLQYWFAIQHAFLMVFSDVEFADDLRLQL